MLLAAVAPRQEFRVAVWRGQLARATFGGQVLCLRPREDLLVSDYLGAWLRLPHVQGNGGRAKVQVGGRLSPAGGHQNRRPPTWASPWPLTQGRIFDVARTLLGNVPVSP